MIVPAPYMRDGRGVLPVFRLLLLFCFLVKFFCLLAVKAYGRSYARANVSNIRPARRALGRIGGVRGLCLYAARLIVVVGFVSAEVEQQVDNLAENVFRFAIAYYTVKDFAL